MLVLPLCTFCGGKDNPEPEPDPEPEVKAEIGEVPAEIKKAVADGIISPNETITTIVTGNVLKDPVNGQKAVSMPEPMKPNLEELDKFLKEKGAI